MTKFLYELPVRAERACESLRQLNRAYVVKLIQSRHAATDFQRGCIYGYKALETGAAVPSFCNEFGA